MRHDTNVINNLKHSEAEASFRNCKFLVYGEITATRQRKFSHSRATARKTTRESEGKAKGRRIIKIRGGCLRYWPAFLFCLAVLYIPWLVPCAADSWLTLSRAWLCLNTRQAQRGGQLHCSTSSICQTACAPRRSLHRQEKRRSEVARDLSSSRIADTDRPDSGFLVTWIIDN